MLSRSDTTTYPYVALTGDFDQGREAELNALFDCLNDAEVVEVDCSALTSVDAVTLGCFVRLKQTLTPGTVVRLLGVQPSIHERFKMAKLDALFSFVGAAHDPSNDAGRQIEDRPSLATFHGATVAAWAMPAGGSLTGGDWCDVIVLSDHRLFITIGDVCGHGESATNEMRTICAAIYAAMRDADDLPAILGKVNTIAYHRSITVPVTAIVALLDLAAKTLTFSNAGHPPPLMIDSFKQGFLSRAPADLPLGFRLEHAASLHTFPVAPNTLFVFYTDGVTEHQRDAVKGAAQLQAAAKFAYESPQQNAADIIAERVLSGASGDDDAAIVTVRT